MRKITTPKGDISIDENDYISLTDIENNEGYQVPETAVNNWFKRSHTLSYLCTWETIHNKKFNVEEMKFIEEGITNGNLKLSLKDYLTKTAAIGINIKSDMQNSIFVHRDILVDYCGWGSNHTLTRAYLMKELVRLKEEEERINPTRPTFQDMLKASEKELRNELRKLYKEQDINNPNRSLWTINLEEE